MMFGDKVLLYLALLPILTESISIDRHATTQIALGTIQGNSHNNNNDKHKHQEYDARYKKLAVNHTQNGAQRLLNIQKGQGRFTAKVTSEAELKNHKHNDLGGFRSSKDKKSHLAAAKFDHAQSGRNISTSKLQGRQSGNSNTSSKRKQHKKDYVLSDSIHYGFDKKFNQDEQEDGIYKINEHVDAHKFADRRDKHRDYKVRRGKSAAASSKIGSQRGVKESAANSFSGDNSMAMGGFFDIQNRNNRKGIHSDNYGSQLDYSAGGKKHANAEAASLDRNISDYNLKQNNHSNGAIDIHQRQDVGGSHAAGRPSKGYQVAGKHSQRLLAGKSFIETRGSGIGLKKSSAQQKRNFKSNSQKRFSKRKNQREYRKGHSLNNQSHSNSVGSNRHKQNSAKHKSASNRKYADASKYYRHSDSAKSMYEKFKLKDNYTKDLRNKDRNKKVSKQFHTSKKVKGDNYERLNFDRKKFEKDRAKDTSSKSKNGSRYDTNYRKTDSKAKHHAESQSRMKGVTGASGATIGLRSVADQDKQNADSNQYGVVANGQFSSGHFGTGFHKFGLTADRLQAEKSRRHRGASNSDFDQNTFTDNKHVQKKSFATNQQYPQNNDVTGYDHDFRRFQRPEQSDHHPFSFAFDHTPFGEPSFSKTFDESFNTQPFGFGGNRQLGPISKPVLPKTSVSLQAGRPYFLHRTTSIPSPITTQQYHPRRTHGGYESLSISNLFSKQFYDRDMNFPLFNFKR